VAPPQFGLVIFDCDGVLVDSEALSDGVVASLLQGAGFPIQASDVNRLSRGRSDRDMWAILEREYGPVPANAQDIYEATMFETLRAVQAIPGACDVVSAVHAAGIPLCVASSGQHAKMDVTLGATGLSAFFDGHIFSATEVERGKPEPDLFLYAARKMGVAPDRCAVIEDSRAGVQAGLAAGMTVFGYAPAEGHEDLALPGAITFGTMSALRDLLSV
jgi:HAD superfamily hydrolase (TIGR01509 family)